MPATGYPLGIPLTHRPQPVDLGFGGLPANHSGVRGAIFDRGGLPSILGESSVARWLSLPAWSGIEGRHSSCHFVPVLCMSATDLSEAGTIFQDTRKPW